MTVLDAFNWSCCFKSCSAFVISLCMYTLTQTHTHIHTHEYAFTHSLSQTYAHIFSLTHIHSRKQKKNKRNAEIPSLGDTKENIRVREVAFSHCGILKATDYSSSGPNDDCKGIILSQHIKFLLNVGDKLLSTETKMTSRENSCNFFQAIATGRKNNCLFRLFCLPLVCQNHSCLLRKA